MCIQVMMLLRLGCGHDRVPRETWSSLLPKYLPAWRAFRVCLPSQVAVLFYTRGFAQGCPRVILSQGWPRVVLAQGWPRVRSNGAAARALLPAVRHPRATRQPRPTLR